MQESKELVKEIAEVSGHQNLCQRMPTTRESITRHWRSVAGGLSCVWVQRVDMSISSIAQGLSELCSIVEDEMSAGYNLRVHTGSE